MKLHQSAGAKKVGNSVTQMATAYVRVAASVVLIGSGCILPTCLYPRLCRMLLWVIGVSGVVTGTEEHLTVPSKARVIVFNHAMFWDHMVLIANLQDHQPLRFVAAAKYIIGPFAWRRGADAS